MKQAGLAQARVRQDHQIPTFGLHLGPRLDVHVATAARPAGKRDIGAHSSRRLRDVPPDGHPDPGFLLQPLLVCPIRAEGRGKVCLAGPVNGLEEDTETAEQAVR
ncbi:hypothetical protein GCM10023081_17140 [Arthrobacter ginkgonis]|uniref:Uncharacterized protein n=1 Tax=Arthrobacter ginkgonis TaxID=1630594 RepID=A0ABP7C781_9MICC